MELDRLSFNQSRLVACAPFIEARTCDRQGQGWLAAMQAGDAAAREGGGGRRRRGIADTSVLGCRAEQSQQPAPVL